MRELIATSVDRLVMEAFSWGRRAGNRSRLSRSASEGVLTWK